MAPSATQKAAAKSSHPCQDSDIDGSENEWKFRAPYKIHENTSEGGGANGKEGEGEGGFKAYYEGGCHCGRVRYQLGRERPVKSKFCHCGTCKRLHGAPFQHAAIFHKEDINFLKGHHNLQWYESSEKTTRHKLPCKVSCEYCGSWIMDEGRSMILLFPGLLELKEGEGKMFKAECHMFYADRMVDVNDSLPKWSGMEGKSELIADSPPEAIKKRKREVEEEEREERARRRGGEDGDGGDK